MASFLLKGEHPLFFVTAIEPHMSFSFDIWNYMTNRVHTTTAHYNPVYTHRPHVRLYDDILPFDAWGKKYYGSLMKSDILKS